MKKNTCPPLRMLRRKMIQFFSISVMKGQYTWSFEEEAWDLNDLEISNINLQRLQQSHASKT